MKKTLAFAAAVAAAAAVGSGVGAIASPQTPQKSIPARIRALEAKVRVLRTQVDTLGANQSCFRALGIAQYGDKTTSGYVWTQDAGATFGLESALDIDTSAAPAAWMAVIQPGCISPSRAPSTRSSKEGKQRIVGLHELK
jgi:hypothetical protein